MKTNNRRVIPLLSLLLAVALVPVTAGPSAAGNNTCFQSKYTIKGTSGNDRLVGTPKADVIHGLGGADVIKGLGGNDRLCGGPGRDRIVGGDGQNSVKGEGGDDTLIGGSAADLIQGGEDDDRIEARGGNDETDGEEGEDKTFGGSGDDVLRDQTRFRDYDDSLIDGGGGDDVIHAGNHDYTGLYGYIHKVVGGPGDDRVEYDDLKIFIGGPGIDVTEGDTEQEYPELEVARGGSGSDFLDGEEVFGGPGDDSLRPATEVGAVLHGGPGDDSLRGWYYDDVMFGDEGNDDLDAGGNYEGTDELFGGDGDDVLDAMDETSDDLLDGGPHVVGDTCTSDPKDTKADCEI